MNDLDLKFQNSSFYFLNFMTIQAMPRKLEQREYLFWLLIDLLILFA